MKLKALVALLACLSLCACSEVEDELEIFEDDFVSPNDPTLDVTLEGTELMTNITLHAYYLVPQYLPFFELFERPESMSDSVIADVSGPASVTYPCDSFGQITYTFSKKLAEFSEDESDSSVYNVEVGDSVSIDFGACLQTSGMLLNGNMELTYSQIEGLNKRFEEVTTEYCIGAVQEDLGKDVPVIDNRDADGNYFLADGVLFERRAETLKYTYIRNVENPGVGEDTFEEILSGEVGAGVLDSEGQRIGDEAVLVIRNVVAQDPNSLPVIYELDPSARPVVGGERVYSIGLDENDPETSPVQSLVACQNYRRTFQASIEDLSVFLPEGFNLSLETISTSNIDLPSSLMFNMRSGRAELVESSNELVFFTREINESNFKVTQFSNLEVVPQWDPIEGFNIGVSREATNQWDLNYADYSTVFNVGREAASYAMTFGSRMTIGEFGIFDVRNLGSVFSQGQWGSIPRSGTYIIEARDVEAILNTLTPDGELTMNVDFDGNPAGGDTPEFDLLIGNTTKRIVEMDFLCAELVDGESVCL